MSITFHLQEGIFLLLEAELLDFGKQVKLAPYVLPQLGSEEKIEEKRQPALVCVSMARPDWLTGRNFTWIVFLCRDSLSQNRNSNQLYKYQGYQELLKVDRIAKTKTKPIYFTATDVTLQF